MKKGYLQVTELHTPFVGEMNPLAHQGMRTPLIAQSNHYQFGDESFLATHIKRKQSWYGHNPSTTRQHNERISQIPELSIQRFISALKKRMQKHEDKVS